MPNAKFVLKEPSAKEETLIYLFYNYANQRLKYSTGEKINHQRNIPKTLAISPTKKPIPVSLYLYFLIEIP